MYYPLMIDLKEKNVTVFGGGKVAVRKVMKFIQYGAFVTVVSPHISDELYDIEKVNYDKIKIINENFSIKYLDQIILVIAATSDRKVNKEIAMYCNEKNILCNVVDSLDESTFIVPSSIRRGDMTIAISTMGKSPSLCKKIKEELEERYPDEFAEYVDLLGETRQIILEKETDDKKKRKILKEITNMNLKELKVFLNQYK